MQTQTPTTQDSIIYQLADQLMSATTNEADRARIERAIDLVPTVERTATPGLFLVPSATTPDGCYRVRDGFCCCPDASKRDARSCKHAVSVILFQQAERADADRYAPPTLTVVCPSDDVIIDLWPVWPTSGGEPCEMEPQRPIGITRLPYTAAQARIADELGIADAGPRGAA